MGKAEEIRRDQARAEAARPAILEWLRSGAEPLAISAEVATRFEVGEEQAYRWVAYIAEDFERRRKRIGVLGLVLIWSGAIIAVAGVVLWFFGVAGPAVPLWLFGLGCGVPVTAAGAIVAANAGRLVRRSV